jgi:hypothetical protein
LKRKTSSAGDPELGAARLGEGGDGGDGSGASEMIRAEHAPLPAFGRRRATAIATAPSKASSLPPWQVTGYRKRRYETVPPRFAYISRATMVMVAAFVKVIETQMDARAEA